MVEVEICFRKNTKIGMLQYGLPGSLEMFDGYIKNLWAAAPTVEQRFIKPVNAGRKSVYQQKMQLQSEVNTIFHLFILAFPSSSPPRGVFRTQSNICDEEFFAKIVNG